MLLCFDRHSAIIRDCRIELVSRALLYKTLVLSSTPFLYKVISIYSMRPRLRLHWTLERFCMEPFRVGTDRLPVYTMPWNRYVQNRSFQSIHLGKS